MTPRRRLSPSGRRCAALLLWPSMGFAQGFVADDPRLIEDVTTFEAGGSYLPSGEFLLVWSDGETGDVVARVHDAVGDPLGAVMTLNEVEPERPGSFRSPAAATAPSGTSVVVWRGQRQDGEDSLSIRARPVSAAGSPIGTELRVSDPSWYVAFRTAPSVAARLDGTFIVRFMASPFDGDPHQVVRNLDATGLPVGADTPVAVLRADPNPEDGVLAVAPDGSALVAWHDRAIVGTDVSGSSIQAHLVDATGVPEGSAFQVNGYTTGEQQVPSLAIAPDGTILAVWSSDGTANPAADADVDDLSIQGQRYGSDGGALGAEFEINEATAGRQRDPLVVADGDGGFAVAWATDKTGPPPQLRLRRVGTDGAPLGAELHLDEILPAPSNNLDLHLASDGKGNLMAIWHVVFGEGLVLRTLSVDDGP